MNDSYAWIIPQKTLDSQSAAESRAVRRFFRTNEKVELLTRLMALETAAQRLERAHDEWNLNSNAMISEEMLDAMSDIYELIDLEI